MASPRTPQDTERLLTELGHIATFADLPKDDLLWLVQHAEESTFAAGEPFVTEGDPAEHMIIILEGEMHMFRREAPGVPSFTARAGQVTGLLPYSRLTHYAGTGRAAVPSRFLRIHKDYFNEMLHRMPELGKRLVAIMSDRIRENTREATQRDKLMALGKLSAGLAHELNNPAAAAQRAAANLMESLENVRDASLGLLRHPMSEDQRKAIYEFERVAGEYSPATAADPLEQSDHEERITSWLESHHVADPWKFAPVLAECAVTNEQLDALISKIGNPAVTDALNRIVSIIVIYGLTRQIENSTKRISDLVGAIKQYSYMDQAPIQEVDIHQGLENTLRIFAHALKAGVKVIRDFDPQLPHVCAYGGELNQVWTNLIDNAIDAMGGKGELRLRTSVALDCVIVEIGDSGPGIPPEIQSRIFDPFFTTKEVGEGTGLGLDTSARIVHKHHGQINVQSRPGDTRFEVRLPVKQPTSEINS